MDDHAPGMSYAAAAAAARRHSLEAASLPPSTHAAVVVHGNDTTAAGQTDAVPAVHATPVPPPVALQTQAPVAATVASADTTRKIASAAAPATGLSDVCGWELKRIFQLLDDNRDGYLTTPQVVTFATAAGLPADPEFFRVARANRDAHESLYAFDGLLATVKHQHRTRQLKSRDLSWVFRHFESLRAEPRFTPGVGFDVSAPTHGVVPAYALRYFLSGVQTANNTQLSEEEVDIIFKELGIRERDAVKYEDVIRMLQGSYRYRSALSEPRV